VYFQ